MGSTDVIGALPVNTSSANVGLIAFRRLMGSDGRGGEVSHVDGPLSMEEILAKASKEILRGEGSLNAASASASLATQVLREGHRRSLSNENSGSRPGSSSRSETGGSGKNTTGNGGIAGARPRGILQVDRDSRSNSSVGDYSSGDESPPSLAELNYYGMPSSMSTDSLGGCATPPHLRLAFQFPSSSQIAKLQAGGSDSAELLTQLQLAKLEQQEVFMQHQALQQQQQESLGAFSSIQREEGFREGAQNELSNLVFSVSGMMEQMELAKEAQRQREEEDEDDDEEEERQGGRGNGDMIPLEGIIEEEDEDGGGGGGGSAGGGGHRVRLGGVAATVARGSGGYAQSYVDEGDEDESDEEYLGVGGGGGGSGSSSSGLVIGQGSSGLFGSRGGGGGGGSGSIGSGSGDIRAPSGTFEFAQTIGRQNSSGDDDDDDDDDDDGGGGVEGRGGSGGSIRNLSSTMPTSSSSSLASSSALLNMSGSLLTSGKLSDNTSMYEDQMALGRPIECGNGSGTFSWSLKKYGDHSVHADEAEAGCDESVALEGRYMDGWWSKWNEHAMDADAMIDHASYVSSSSRNRNKSSSSSSSGGGGGGGGSGKLRRPTPVTAVPTSEQDFSVWLEASLAAASSSSLSSLPGGGAAAGGGVGLGNGGPNLISPLASATGYRGWEEDCLAGTGVIGADDVCVGGGSYTNRYAADVTENGYGYHDDVDDDGGGSYYGSGGGSSGMVAVEDELSSSGELRLTNNGGVDVNGIRHVRFQKAGSLTQTLMIPNFEDRYLDVVGDVWWTGNELQAFRVEAAAERRKLNQIKADEAKAEAKRNPFVLYTVDPKLA